MDPTPTGFEPADRLLAAIAVEPERSLDGWLDERRIGLRDVVDANVASGRWQRRSGPFGFGRRYDDLRPEQTERDRRRPGGRRRPTPGRRTDACVIAIADGGRAAGRRALGTRGGVPTSCSSATGPVAWLAGAVVDHVLRDRRSLPGQAGALGAGGLGPF